MPGKGTIDTPEAWDLRRIRLVVQAVADGEDIAAATGLSQRHVGYHLQAARILGWISARRPSTVTTAGRELLGVPAQSAAEARLMRAAVQASEPVTRVVPALFDGLSIDTVAEMLAANVQTGLSASTARKRASTLVRWRDQLTATLGRPSEPGVVPTSPRQADRLLIVHLSDVHLRQEEELSRLLSRAPSMAAAVAARPDTFGVDACLLIVSGDVAFSGKPAEYALATRLLDAVERLLRERFPTCPIYVLLVPGNHDCDFGKHQGMREKLIADVDPTKVDASYVDGCISVQKAFWEFCAPRHPNEGWSVEEQPAMQIRELALGTRKLRFQLVNSAWMSTLTEQQGAIVVPEKTIEAMGAASPAADLVVSVFHHGYNWLEANNARRFRDAVERTSDVVLTGHEHVADHFSKEGSSGQNSWHIEGGVLADSSEPDHSSFNAVVLDFGNSELQIVRLKWNAEQGMYVVEGEQSSSFQRNQ